jgi:hypothetical protein
MTDPTIRFPRDLRRVCARKLLATGVQGQLRAVLGCLLGQHWTTPRVVELAVMPDGLLRGRCEGDPCVVAFVWSAADLVRSFRRTAQTSGLDPDEVGYVIGQITRIRRWR